jgi:hypothetical protein
MTRLITADASQVSASAFLDAILGITHEQRAEQRRLDIERCINAIQRNDTYGNGPRFYREGGECKAIGDMIADGRAGSAWRALLRRVERELRTTIEMQRKVA